MSWSELQFPNPGSLGEPVSMWNTSELHVEKWSKPLSQCPQQQSQGSPMRGEFDEQIILGDMSTSEILIFVQLRFRSVPLIHIDFPRAMLHGGAGKVFGHTTI